MDLLYPPVHRRKCALYYCCCILYRTGIWYRTARKTTYPPGRISELHVLRDNSYVIECAKKRRAIHLPKDPLEILPNGRIFAGVCPACLWTKRRQYAATPARATRSRQSKETKGGMILQRRALRTACTHPVSGRAFGRLDDLVAFFCGHACPPVDRLYQVCSVTSDLRHHHYLHQAPGQDTQQQGAQNIYDTHT